MRCNSCYKYFPSLCLKKTRTFFTFALGFFVFKSVYFYFWANESPCFDFCKDKTKISKTFWVSLYPMVHYFWLKFKKETLKKKLCLWNFLLIFLFSRNQFVSLLFWKDLFQFELLWSFRMPDLYNFVGDPRIFNCFWKTWIFPFSSMIHRVRTHSFQILLMSVTSIWLKQCTKENIWTCLRFCGVLWIFNKTLIWKISEKVAFPRKLFEYYFFHDGMSCDLGF